MSKKDIDVLCIGLMVCDIIAKPVGKEIFDIDSHRVDTLNVASGGDAFNAAVNISKLGMNAALLGKIGNDMMGDFLSGQAESHGIDTKYIKRSEGMPTSTSIVLVESDGERHFAYHGEANDALSQNDIDDSTLESARIVHYGSAMALAGLDGKSISEIFKKAKNVGAITSMDVTWDSTGQWLKKIEDALMYTDIFMPSIQEAKLISGSQSPEEIADFFKEYAIKTLVIKMGEEGCYITDFKQNFTIPAFCEVDIVDTIGAGDAFVSGFLVGILQDFDLYECGILGNAVAASCVTQAGATTGVKSWCETLEFIEKYRS